MMSHTDVCLMCMSSHWLIPPPPPPLQCDIIYEQPQMPLEATLARRTSKVQWAVLLPTQ